MSNLSSFRLIVFTLIAVIVAMAAPAWAQKDAGSIVGTVRDQSGAVVSHAKVTVADVERGSTFEATTNDAGEYVASPLRVGQYTVTVEHSGFKKAVSAPVNLDVQQRIAVNVTLQIGQISESIEVTGAAPLLETETSELGQVVDNKRVANLPLNGRNFAQLALLTAGTAPSEPGARDEGGFGFSAGGARSLQNNFLLDGVDNNSNLPDLLNETNYVIQPSVEALEEFKVQTNAYSAEFGRGNGAIINATIKSGSNRFHGSVYEFLRNEKFDAKNFFDDPNSRIAPYKQNQFGFTFGGPLVRNRTFFFVDYEGLRIRQAQTLTSTVPTLAQRSGDFSSQLDLSSPQQALAADGTTLIPALDCAGHPTYAGEIFDTRQTQANGAYLSGLCGVPFGGYDGSGNPVNLIPQSQVDPLALAITQLFPQPNVNGNGFNFLSNPVRQETRNNFDVRIDQKYTENDNGFFRFSYEDQPSVIPGPFNTTNGDGGGFFGGIEDNAYRSFATSWTHLFRPELSNEFRLGYNRINSQRNQINFNKTSEQLLGIPFPGIPNVPDNGGLPQLTFSDVSQIGSPTFLPSHEIQNSYSLLDNLSWVHGGHAIKLGTEIRAEEFTIFQPAAPRGTLDFGPVFTDNPAAQGNGGSGFASFLIGLSDGGSINNLHNIDYHRPVYAFYVQDDWKVTPKLTLNLGLRYELFTTVKERHNQMATFDLATDSLIVPKGVNVQLTPTLFSIIPIRAIASPGLIPPDLNNFAPRIGLAYRATEKLVIRTGYGVFYGGSEAGPYSNPSMGFNPPFFTIQNFNNPCGQSTANPAVQDCSLASAGIPTLASGFPANALIDPNTPLLFSIDPHLVTPYMQQWHLSAQYELPTNTVFEATYAGSRGLKQYIYLNGNQALPDPSPNPPPLDTRRPFPPIDGFIGWFRSAGQSNYHSLQLRAEKRFSHGLTFLASYTWAHAMDIASSADLGAQNGGDFRFYQTPNREYGNSDFDIRHRLVLSYLYELPFGHGKPMLSSASGPLNYIVGGWQIGGITSFSTGNSFTILDTNSFSNSDGQSRPDLVSDPFKAGPVPANPDPNCQLTISQGGLAADRTRVQTSWVNACAFTDPAFGSFGNVGRNTVQGPGYQIWDFSLFKIFPITEGTRLEFRAEFFNVFNHPNLQFAKSGPQNSINTTTFGTPEFGFLTAARDPRQVQFALKLSF
ncbi:MAG: TonB-dependent receptor [Acidobacteria bacterium]|nr:MAG: TonB-dependent receptor [Acidobacteriota bacterium]